MAFEDYTIRQYIRAQFSQDYSERGIPKDILDIVNSEYIDAACLYDEDEFQRVAYIHFLNGRINSIRMSIDLQRKYLLNFEIPYLPGLSFFKKYGHNLKWNDHIGNFLDQLHKVENSEKKYISKLEIETKQLIERKLKSKKPQEITNETTRKSFIRTINSLGRIGWKIDMDKTTMEEFSIIILQQSEDSKK